MITTILETLLIMGMAISTLLLAIAIYTGALIADFT
jgi:hypothetical protein